MTRRIFYAHLVAASRGIIFRVIEHEAYCEGCHFMWNLPKRNVLIVPDAGATKPFY